MLEPIGEPSNIVNVFSQLSQYPILAPQIRERMREELFWRGIVRPDRLEEEVKDRAIISQKREGLNNPMFEEDEGIWLQRQRFIRDYLTDFYFAHNLPIELLHTLVRGREPAHGPRGARRTALQSGTRSPGHAAQQSPAIRTAAGRMIARKFSTISKRSSSYWSAR